jgi:hypothetical protein
MQMLQKSVPSRVQVKTAPPFPAQVKNVPMGLGLTTPGAPIRKTFQAERRISQQGTALSHWLKFSLTKAVDSV